MQSFNWYTKLAMRTYIFQKETKARLEEIETTERVLDAGETHQLLHGILGMVGESAEILSVPMTNDYEKVVDDLQKEMGDWMWYLAIAADAMKVTIDELLRQGEMNAHWAESGRNIAMISCAMAENLKKWLFYGKRMKHDELIELMAEGLAYISYEMTEDQFSKMLHDNIGKLKIRFPDAFSPEAAIARADA